MKVLKNRKFQILAAAAGAVAGVHLFSALTLDRTLQYKEVPVVSARIPAELDGYTIAFLSDIHNVRAKELETMAARLRELAPELVLYGGDFSGVDVAGALRIMASVEPPDGIYGVEGNHDDAERLRPLMQAQGITLLENSGVRVRDGLYIGGLEDLWNRDPDPRAAIAGAEAGDFVLMLAHNPDTANERDMQGVDLVVSGHTHGGEVSLFGLWAPPVYLVSNNGHQLRTGWCTSAQGVDVYVGNGIGRHSPLRVFVRPQVILFKLRSA